MNRENNGLPENSAEQHMADVSTATWESLYRLEGEYSCLVEELPSLADYSAGTLSGDAIR